MLPQKWDSFKHLILARKECLLSGDFTESSGQPRLHLGAKRAEGTCAPGKQQGYCRAMDLSCCSTLHGQVYSMPRSHKAFFLPSHKNNLHGSVSFRYSMPLQRGLNWVKKQRIPNRVAFIFVHFSHFSSSTSHLIVCELFYCLSSHSFIQFCHLHLGNAHPFWLC